MACNKREYFNPETLIKSSVFTQVIKAPVREIVFISGQVALNAKGELSGTSFEMQLHGALENVSTSLASAGVEWKDVMQLRIFVVNLRPENRITVQMALEKIFGDQQPATNSLIGVQALARKDLRVEIEAIAISK